MASATDLYDLQDDLLTVAAAALDTLEPGLQGAPARAFVSAGQPAFDCCPQLTVHATAVSEQPPVAGSGQAPRYNGRKNHVALTVTIVRCVKVIEDVSKPPSVTLMDADAQQHSADAWALWNILYNEIRSDDLFRLCADARPALRVVNPQGGCAGWQMSYVVELEGYNDEIGT